MENKNRQQYNTVWQYFYCLMNKDVCILKKIYNNMGKHVADLLKLIKFQNEKLENLHIFVKGNLKCVFLSKYLSL